MDRPITRRDFLNGVSIAVTGSLLGPSWLTGCSSNEPTPAMEADYYPPAQTGMRGSHDGTFEVAHHLRDGRLSRRLGTPTDTGEVYDLSSWAGDSAAWLRPTSSARRRARKPGS